jgi:hypothetical protein
MIRYLQRAEIDTLNWDRCIEGARNGLIYAYSHYLDVMARHWDALVYNDYEAVMPLTWNRKWGVHYLYQPFCTAQLGVMGRQITDELVALFISSIPSKFRYIDIDLNEGNKYEASGLRIRSNYTLDLSENYTFLQQNYNRHARRKLNKAVSSGLRITEGLAVEELVELYLAMMQGRERIALDEVKRFTRLCKEASLFADECNSIAALNQEGQVVSSDLYMVKKGRVYSLLAGNSEAAYDTGAFYFVLDYLIRKFAGTGYLLDFEGSDLPGIAFLFRCLGGVHRQYPHIQINRLPLPVRWLKK